MDENVKIMRVSDEVRKTWVEYFEQVLNVKVVREGIINVLGERRVPVLGELNENNIEKGSQLNEISKGSRSLIIENFCDSVSP